MSAIKDLTGQRFGRLTVVRDSGERRWGSICWVCKCECGREKIVESRNLMGIHHTKSCGCLREASNRKRLTTHGMRHTRPYTIWCGMKRRCQNVNDHAYPRYGGRGITVCSRWVESFQNFWEDMKEGYRDGLTIERKDFDKGYNKGNCCWATYLEQGNNKRNNHFLTFQGKTKTISQWENILGFPVAIVRQRICKRGWSVEKALTTPKLR